MARLYTFPGKNLASAVAVVCHVTCHVEAMRSICFRGIEPWIGIMRFGYVGSAPVETVGIYLSRNMGVLHTLVLAC